MKCCASAVITTRTSHFAFVSSDAKSAALCAAMEPVTPRMTLVFIIVILIVILIFFPANPICHWFLMQSVRRIAPNKSDQHGNDFLQQLFAVRQFLGINH